MWGSGRPRRELIYVDDVGDACLFLMENKPKAELINIGTGKDYQISEIANIVKEIVGFDEEIEFDRSKPDGAFRKLLDNGKIKSVGWKAKFPLKEGIKCVYKWYLDLQLTSKPRINLSVL